MPILQYNKETDLIKEKIYNDSSTGKAQIDFIESMIREFHNSETFKSMEVSARYYKNQNDILNAKRKVIGRDAENRPILVESRVLSNNKLTHNFYKKLVRQKIAYMIARPYMLKPVKADDKLTEQFIEEISDGFTLDFHKMLKNVCRDSITKGLGWVQVFYNEKGELDFKRIPPEEVIPIWSDDDHTILSAVIRRYTITVYDGGNHKDVEYVEYYTEEGVFYYRKENNGYVVDTTVYESGVSPNFTIIEKDENGVDTTKGVMWNKIPFIPFKYDPDEQNLLERIKSLIDDYDKKTSDLANQIDDMPNSVTVIKNYDGASKEEFIANKNQFRSIFVQGDGDAKALETPLDISGLELHLERLRQDIYEFGQGVNASNKDIRDTSGVALRFMYADLDMDCSDWGCELKWSLKLLMWFKIQDILLKKNIDYTNCNYDVVFDTDVIVNETETITNCFTSKGIISDRTIALNHPWTIDAEYEIKNMLQDKEQVLDLEAEYEKDNTTPTTKE